MAGLLLPPKLQQPLTDFRLAEKLGQGAFGSVYKALNWTTGETCAVKKIDLSHIPEGDLPEIMSEIDLLKNLHHPNIVQYRGYHRTASSLYIVLEYCENGSLAALVRKFGRIPESLVGLYVLQVLHGLQYLHEQGVIHRDIKGSNILATKEGSIKLADFGVATRVAGSSSTTNSSEAQMAVVGSPYWMAPEVVDQSAGASPASDIWSLGALVIELLTSKPPYHFLDPMPALFRIVADEDGPPLPEGASGVVRDFLGQCFQKDPNLRVTAKKLLRHPWMMVAKKQAERQRREVESRKEMATATTPPEDGSETASLSFSTRGGEEGGGGAPTKEVRSKSSAAARSRVAIGSRYEDEVAKVQEFNQALQAAPPLPPVVSRLARNGNLPPKQRTPTDENVDPDIATATSPSRPPLGPVLHRPKPTPTHTPTPVLRSTQSRLPEPTCSTLPSTGGTTSPAKGRREEGDEGDQSAWDRDFEDEGVTIRPQSSFAAASSRQTSNLDRNATLQVTTLRTTDSRSLADLEEGEGEVDYSDLVQDEKDADVLQSRIKEYQARPRVQPQLLRPSDLVGSLPSQLISPDPRSRLDSFAEEKDEEEDWENELVDGFGGNGMQTAPLLRNAVADSLDVAKLSPGLNSPRVASPARMKKIDSDEEDPFAAVEAEELGDSGGSDDDLAPEALARDQLARQAALVTDLVSRIEQEDWREGREGKRAALQLMPLLELWEEARAAFVKAHGMLVVLGALRIASQQEHVAVLLRVANLVVGADGNALEKLALVGGCPVITAFSSRRYSREIRLEAALFIGAMCRTSLLTLQMFVSAQGLRILVEMLEERYDRDKDLVWMAIDGLCRVFEMEGHIPRSDICRVLVAEGLLDPLSTALLSLCGDDDELAISAKTKTVRLLLTLSQSDHKVKEAIAQRRIISRLVSAVKLLQSESLVGVLKSIKNVSMVTATLDALQSAGVIEMLARILATPTVSGRLAAEFQNPAVNTLFNLCRLSKSRQDAAAAAGVIPLLQKIVSDNSPLKQFALPILCDFAHASRACRRRLWAHDGVAFYVQLLKDPFWVNPALEAIAAWLQEEPTRVEASLLEPTAIEALVNVVCKTRTAVFENLVEPLHKLVRCSTALAAQLATQLDLLKRVVERIERASRTVIRLGLLRLAKTLFDSLARRPRDRDKAVQVLSAPVQRLANEEDGPVLVRELAKTLQDEFGSKQNPPRRCGFSRRAASISEDISQLLSRSPPLPPPSPSPSFAVATSSSDGLVRSRSYLRRR
ncbi:kinase-like protein [Rhodotorula sp. JG-1b]|nr:kinase-like protein [Rhodotorula sp. JG-1b]